MSFESIKSVRVARSLPSSHCVLWAAVGAATLSLFALGANAGESPQVTVKQKVVRYADLDLSKQSDAAALYARLRRASDSVCGQEDNRNLAMQRAHEACSGEALSDAVTRVNASALTALHAADGRIRVAERRAEGGPRT